MSKERRMASEERTAWIAGVVALVAYGVYLFVVAARVGDAPLTEVDYVAPLLWTIGGAIGATIVLTIVGGILTPGRPEPKDQRDRQIYRFGEHTGQSFLAIGGIVALLLALGRIDQFWIANVLYLGFVLSTVLGSLTKIAAYRRGLPEW